MDIINHAVAGAAVGASFNAPILGAIIAILPDVPIFGPRRKEPTEAYMFTHSFLFLFILTGAAIYIENISLGTMVFLCILSHLVLDIPTHGKTWSPALFYPDKVRFVFGHEWEFFNDTWFYGLKINFVWCFIWGIIWIVL